MARPRRNVAVILTPDEWDRLVLAALRAERDPFQQARWLVLRGLGADADATLEETATADVA